MEQTSDLLNKTINFAKSFLLTNDAGHDWAHTERVLTNARAIRREEGNGNLLIIELAAILHDIADTKFSGKNEDESGKLAHEFLINMGVREDKAEHIKHIINNISFRKHHEVSSQQSIEFLIVQDADRLDAIGAIGIARAFHYGGHKNRPLYDPSIKPEAHENMEQYKKSTAPTINHFYEKLFLLKDMMRTAAGKRMAEERHAFMETFVEKFKQEWNMGQES
jgi:uncharacterized protein